MTELLCILVLSTWVLVLIYISFANDWISFFIIASAFVFSLFFINGVISFLNLFSWVSAVETVIMIIKAAALIIGSLIIYKFYSLIMD